MRLKPIALNSLYIYSKINILAYCNLLFQLKKPRKGSGLGQVIPQVRRKTRGQNKTFFSKLCYLLSLSTFQILAGLGSPKSCCRREEKDTGRPRTVQMTRPQTTHVQSVLLHWLSCVTFISRLEAQVFEVH